MCTGGGFVSAISCLYLLWLPPRSVDTVHTLRLSFDGGERDYPQHLRRRRAHLSPAPQIQHLLFSFFLLPLGSAVREMQVWGNNYKSPVVVVVVAAAALARPVWRSASDLETEAVGEISGVA